ncbi:cupredoxin domain-containing protein [Aneurinibacillus sp. Ricciae_BoGa-3]|uniref:cupredoxin domain-containing protein n=1 Tax=Aneurinibacillus sp. Ricciae_BoGa-3 TaxID=3022697 RepID=UPI00233FA3D4|nr:cupredoxin domain-containing protein [Aneurinibacillus sp. Ricciae_BoGa-3]WCK54569.1 cupredoxin domain-containing protein [Aneurinibacillus sp. Ricciae_BoGa-3]
MKKKTAILFAISALTVSMLSACGTSTKQPDNSSAPTAPSSGSKAFTGKTEVVKITAKNFAFDKKEIHVKKGDKVKVTLASVDGYHGLQIPEYNVNLQGNQTAEFIADKPGTFEYHCSVMCGTGHDQMVGKLIVG